MSKEEALQALKRVAEIATLAGIKGSVDEERGVFRGGFQVAPERGQKVFVRPSTRTPQGKLVVTFYSPCLAVKTGFLKGISKDQALELLKQNEKMLFARYGIWSGDGEDMIVASVDHILDTLDAEELHTHMWAVASYADAYEREHQEDKF